MEPGTERRLLDFAAVFSLVNLSFLIVWRELVFVTEADRYWLPDFNPTTYLAGVVNLVGFTILLWLGACVVRRWNHGWPGTLGRVFFVLLLVFPANFFRWTLGVKAGAVLWLSEHRLLVLIVASIIVPAGTYFVVRYFRALVRAYAFLLLVLSLFGVLVLGRLLWNFGREARAGEGDPSTSVAQVGLSDVDLTPGRLVWLMFDELDLRVAFTDVPDGLDLPNFSRLQATSLFAIDGENHSMSTQEAIPSYQVGSLVERGRPVDERRLKLRFEATEQPIPSVEGESAYWTDVPTFFSEAHALGARIAVVGLYHPYCRVFSRETSRCTSFALNTFAPRTSGRLLDEIWLQLRGITPVYRRLNAIATYEEIRAAALDWAVAPDIDVLYVHFSVPHGPYIYNRTKAKFTPFNFSRTGYFDNLVLADKVLGEIWGAMEAAGEWEQSTVLVTSDHEWREPTLYDGERTRKVPFLLKLPGQSESRVHEETFSPVLVTKDLLLTLLSGELGKLDDVTTWLKERGNGS